MHGLTAASARARSEKHHDEHITESDLAQSIIHVKSHVFEVMLKEVTGAIGSIGVGVSPHLTSHPHPPPLT